MWSVSGIARSNNLKTTRTPKPIKLELFKKTWGLVTPFNQKKPKQPTGLVFFKPRVFKTWLHHCNTWCELCYVWAVQSAWLVVQWRDAVYYLLHHCTHCTASLITVVIHTRHSLAVAVSNCTLLQCVCNFVLDTALLQWISEYAVRAVVCFMTHDYSRKLWKQYQCELSVV